MPIASIATNTGNPIDLVEEVACANEWPFERPGEDELMFVVCGRWYTYQLHCLWHSGANAMLLAGRSDLVSPQSVPVELYKLLAMVNTLTWLGHFDLSPDLHEITFRHTVLLAEKGISTDQFFELVGVAISEYERFYPTFQFVLEQKYTAEQAVEAAVVEVVGQA